MSEGALREIEKLSLRLGGLERVEDDVRISLRLCLEKWRKLLESQGREAPMGEDLLRVRLDAYQGLQDALEMMSKVEHGRSRIAESIDRLLLEVEKTFQDCLKNS